jgi:hypothetical protein
MKELKIHNNEKGNLLSIKPVDDTYSDRSYFIIIITTLFALTKGCFHVQASRPNYNTIDLAIQLKGILSSNCNFRYTDFEISFCNTKAEENLLEFLPLIWFAYEHISISFFIENKIEIDIKRKSWDEITKSSKSYVLFKGVEEDVIWIGKSSELEFDLGLSR